MSKRPRRIYALILELGSRVRTFTPRNLTPALTADQARRNCAELAQLGELERVVPGRRGRYTGAPAIYRRRGRGTHDTDRLATTKLRHRRPAMSANPKLYEQI